MIFVSIIGSLSWSSQHHSNRETGTAMYWDYAHLAQWYFCCLIWTSEKAFFIFLLLSLYIPFVPYVPFAPFVLFWTFVLFRTFVSFFLFRTFRSLLVIGKIRKSSWAWKPFCGSFISLASPLGGLLCLLCLCILFVPFVLFWTFVLFGPWSFFGPLSFLGPLGVFWSSGKSEKVRGLGNQFAVPSSSWLPRLVVCSGCFVGCFSPLLQGTHLFSPHPTIAG